MKTVKKIVIIVFVASILAGCGQNGMKEYEQQATSAPNQTRVPTAEVTPEVTPAVTEGEGFAYKDEFLGVFTIIEGEGWEVETHYEERLVVFYNEHINEYGNNATLFQYQKTDLKNCKWMKSGADLLRSTVQKILQGKR